MIHVAKNKCAEEDYSHNISRKVMIQVMSIKNVKLK